MHFDMTTVAAELHVTAGAGGWEHFARHVGTRIYAASNVLTGYRYGDMGVAFAKPSSELVNKIVNDHDADIVIHAGDIGL